MDHQPESEPPELTQVFDFLDANRRASGIDDARDMIGQISWVFLTRWQKVKTAFALLRQALR